MAYNNLAYQNDSYLEQFGEQERQRAEARRISKKEKLRLQHRQNARIICVIIALFCAAYYMIAQNVQVNDTANQIKDLKKELAVLESNTSQKTFELEQSVDLNQVEQIATTKLGMQRPEKYQTVYINIKTEDVTEVTAGDVEGKKAQLGAMAGKLYSNVFGIFPTFRK